MPETVPGITFNEEGVCSFCLGYKKEEYLGKEAFDKIIDSIRGEGEKYDCIVPLSGGRASTFLLYLANVEYGLKVLAVNYDNEFNEPQARTNMKTACDTLGIDFLSFRSKKDTGTQVVRNEVRAAIPLGLYALSESLCSPCVYGRGASIYRAAEEHGVPLILWGDSQAEGTLDMVAKAVADMTIPRGQKLLNRLFNVNCYRVRFYKFLMRRELHAPGNGVLFNTRPALKNENIRDVHVFRYLHWDRERMKEIVANKLGWTKPAGHVSTWRTDCVLHPLMNLFYFAMIGCSLDCFGYCKMINGGHMDRASALEQEEAMAAQFKGDVKPLLRDTIGLTDSEAAEIDALLKQSPHLK